MKISGIRPLIDVMAFAEGDKNEPPTRIKLVPVGKYKTRAYGEVTITRDAIQEMANHFNEGVRAGGKDAGLPIDIEHGTTPYKDRAAGWIKAISAEEDGGYGDIEWTPLGKQLLTDKEYKFYSPEFHPRYADPENTDVRLNNVMTGGGLVNKPMFKKDLPALMMTEGGNEADQNALLTGENKSFTVFLELENSSDKKPMDVKTIIAKEKSTRTAAEQTFLADHKEELTFAEAKTEGFAQDFKETPKADDKPVIKAGEGQVIMAKEDVDQLRTMAEQGVAAKKQLERDALVKEVKELTFSDKGSKIPADQVEKYADLMLKMSEDDRKNMKEMLKALPEKEIFTENGTEKAITGSSAAGVELDKKAKELMANTKGMTYSEAIGRAAAENPQLYAEYNENLPVAGVER